MSRGDRVVFTWGRLRQRPRPQVKGAACHWTVVQPGRWRWVFGWRPWFGLQLLRSGPVTPEGPATIQYRRLEAYGMKRPSSGSGGGTGRHQAAMETERWRDHMALVEHMAIVQYDDGTPRQPGYVTVRTQGRAWVVDVKDPDTCLSFRVLSESLDAALEQAALLLTAEAAPWEPDPWLRARNREKKK